MELITSECIYYSDGERMYALSTSDHCVVADGEFAEEGYSQSVNAIYKGTEKLLWGELSDQEEDSDDDFDDE